MLKKCQMGLQLSPSTISSLVISRICPWGEKLQQRYTRQQQRQNEAKLSNDDNEICKSSEKKKEVVKVAKDVKEQRKGTSNKVPKGFFRIDKVVNHREEVGETEYLVRRKGYDESHDEWKKEEDSTSAALRDEYREQLKRTIIDDSQQKGEECKQEKLEEQHQLDVEEETDDVKKVEKHMHEMLGHLGLAQVQGCEGLVKLLDGVGDNRHCTACELTKCKLPPFPTGKTFRLKRVDPLDKCYIDLSGHISEESGFDKFQYYCSSVTRKGFGVIRGLRYKSQALMGVGLRYKSQALMGVNKIFNETGVPDETQIDGEDALLWLAQRRRSGLTD